MKIRLRPLKLEELGLVTDNAQSCIFTIAKIFKINDNKITRLCVEKMTVYV